jgi:AraC-like DNA-binding protein
MNSRLESIRDGQWAALAREAKCQPESLAAICGVSLRHLQRFFRYKFGETPSAWLLELRLRQAQALLRQGHSTKAIAQELNFTDPAHFCHAFKKRHGHPPQTVQPLSPPDVA